MFKNVGLGLLILSAALSPQVYGQTHALQPGVTLVYEFPPNSPQEFVNFTFMTLKASCKINTPDTSDTFLAEAKAKKGSVNGIPLSAGQSMQLDVHPNDILRLTAESGAKVVITNHGAHTVKAACSV